MILSGNELIEVLKRSQGPIKLKNEANRTVRMMSASQALDLGTDMFVGVGNRKRIRWIRPVTTSVTLNRGSVTTERIKNADGQHIAHPQIREHRPIRFHLAVPLKRKENK
jgi:expansin (peptidoglycan-binding protein)